MLPASTDFLPLCANLKFRCLQTHLARNEQTDRSSSNRSAVQVNQMTLMKGGEMNRFVLLCSIGLCFSLNSAPSLGVPESEDSAKVKEWVEYRRDLVWRLGAVGFAGLGALAETLGDLGGSDVKPGGGVGVRFLLAKQNRINLRFDYAWGQDSSAFYIGLGEAF